MYFSIFFFQAEDGIRDLVRSRGLGDVYKRQDMTGGGPFHVKAGEWTDDTSMALCLATSLVEMGLSLIHI